MKEHVVGGLVRASTHPTFLLSYFPSRRVGACEHTPYLGPRFVLWRRSRHDNLAPDRVSSGAAIWDYFSRLAREGKRVLNWRSIRTKIIAALTLLSAILLLLAVSGFWGLYGYQRTANAVILRAKQLPHARKLNNLATEMRDSNDSILGILRREGMIDSLNPNQTKATMEQNRFSIALVEFQVALQKYSQWSTAAEHAAIQSKAAASASTISQGRSLASVQASFALVDSHCSRPQPLVWTNREPLRYRLEKLVAATRQHVSAIEAEMGELSDVFRAHYRTWTWIAGIGALLLLSTVAGLLWSFNSFVVKPFRTLLDGSRLVAGGQFDHRIDLGSGDELGELAVAMNDMADRFQGAIDRVKSLCNDLDRQVHDRSREVIQNEQLASVGFLAAGVAHEINNPLAAIAWSAESLELRVGELVQQPSDQRIIDEELSKCLTDNLRRIEEEAFRCKGITERLLDFSRLGEVRRAPTNLTQLVHDVVAMVGKVGKYRCKKIDIDGQGDVVAHVNPQEMRQVVLNLVTNSLESVDPQGAVKIDIVGDEQSASIRIEDNGCGMSDEVLKHLFEPFFTRRRDGTGTGLGLSITYRIVSQHGGSLTAHSDGEGLGSRMEIRLPVDLDPSEFENSQTTIGLEDESQKAA